MMMPCMCNKVVVFDLDDTLYKEIDFLKSAYSYIARLTSNEKALEEDIYRLMWNTFQQGGNAFETVVKRFGFKLFNVEWMLGVYRNHKPIISLDKDVKDTLVYLRDNGTTMGIISDGRIISQNNKISALGLQVYINEENIIINDIKERFKPDIRSFRLFEDKFGKDVEYLYVGNDTGKDFVGPNVLGWTTVCLIDDGRNIRKQDFKLDTIALPKVKIQSIGELLQLI